MSSTATAAEQLTFTGLEIFSTEKIGRMFSRMLHLQAEAHSPAGEALMSTGIEADTCCRELTELTEEWREQEITMLLESLSANHTADFGEALRARLFSLRTMLRGEEQSASDISMDSLRAFLVFLHQMARARRPSISLTSEGEIYARWQAGEGRLLAVHFITGEKVRFIAFRPNPNRPQIVQRVSGVDAADTVLQTANRACSVLDWVEA